MITESKRTGPQMPCATTRARQGVHHAPQNITNSTHHPHTNRATPFCSFQHSSICMSTSGQVSLAVNKTQISSILINTRNLPPAFHHSESLQYFPSTV